MVLKKKQTIEQFFQKQMENEVRSHQIPHMVPIDGFMVRWYPEPIETEERGFLGIMHKKQHVEYFLTVTNSKTGETLRGSREAYLRGEKPR